MTATIGLMCSCGTCCHMIHSSLFQQKAGLCAIGHFVPWPPIVIFWTRKLCCHFQHTHVMGWHKGRELATEVAQVLFSIQVPNHGLHVHKNATAASGAALQPALTFRVQRVELPYCLHLGLHAHHRAMPVCYSLDPHLGLLSVLLIIACTYLLYRKNRHCSAQSDLQGPAVWAARLAHLRVWKIAQPGKLHRDVGAVWEWRVTIEQHHGPVPMHQRPRVHLLIHLPANFVEAC